METFIVSAVTVLIFINGINLMLQILDMVNDRRDK